jgi:hypothetical protein
MMGRIIEARWIVRAPIGEGESGTTLTYVLTDAGAWLVEQAAGPTTTKGDC